ncbi:winged helix-turn-helix transcriptional regulator [Metabacillus sp. KIGAM252]|uniref:Winged helix-turn-helix transcriptional regulator n=1 Tax=Metabacillus flavus TaxID=2823519 RepID=A0ABS5LBV0_9BACI|nr:metalloregulator ArsR/SmtB family transcription factor [Metabacillus flavus]MBS2968091.1 winged helix-turn-helix transcriptional regulator [Metabacillus flavus]
MTVQPKTIELEEAAIIMKLLGDKTRLTMMKMLQKNECCVCEFTAIFQASQPAISQHLRKLKDAGLVKEKRNGQWIFYSLNRESEMYEFVQNLLAFIPDQDQKLKDLEKQGLRITCE